MTVELAKEALTKITKICADHNCYLGIADIRYHIFSNKMFGRFSVFSHMNILFTHIGRSEKHFYDIILPAIKSEGLEADSININNKKREYTAAMRIK